LPVAGSGTRACRKLTKDSGVAAKKAGSEISSRSQVSPPLATRIDRPRTLRLLSDAFGLPPPTEKRTLAGTLFCPNSGPSAKSRALFAGRNCPTAQKPLACEARMPACDPKAPLRAPTRPAGLVSWAWARGAPAAPIASTAAARVLFMMDSCSNGG
jgi:hypothetical protein